MKAVWCAAALTLSMAGQVPVMAAPFPAARAALAGNGPVLPNPVQPPAWAANPNAGAPSPAGLATHARSAVVMDFATGKVLFAKDPHARLPMASITKIMTMLLVMEAVDQGKAKWSDPVKTSEHAASMGGSQIFLEPGETMTLADMMKGVAIASANDASVALAEHLYGSEDVFVQRMNQRARELGMKDTHFVNCNGLPAPNHYSSAYDIALMSRELLKHEQITRWTSVYSDYLRKDTAHPLWLVNTNKLVRFYEGVDGLKTGYTSEAQYCLSATAKRGDFRVIVVVMGEPKPSVRNAEVAQLFNWAFSQFEAKVLYRAGQRVTLLRVPHGIPEQVPVVAGDTVGVIAEKGSNRQYTTEWRWEKVQPPLKAGQRVGTLVVREDGQPVSQVPLLAAVDVQRASFWQSIGKTIRRIVTFGRG